MKRRLTHPHWFIASAAGFAVAGVLSPTSDVAAHGTLVANIVASNSNILAGVTTRTTLLAVKVCALSGCPGSAILYGIIYAAGHGADYAAIPCYCGCGEDPTYRNLRDCFIFEDGVFNPHGANCLVCLEQAEDAMRWKGQGLSTGEIRERMDAEYRGRGTPTETPPVEERDDGTS